MRSADITFVILTKDEAAGIGSCLASVPAVSPVVVYDAESVDATPRIATSRGATVVTAPWRGFVAARNAAAAFVKTPWTFMLDADERVSAALANELAALEPADEVAGYSVCRQNMFCGRWIRGAGWWPDRLVRLFRTGKATLSARAGAVHERWVPDGAVGELRGQLVHLPYPSTDTYRRKFAAYTSLEADARSGTFARTAVAMLVAPLRFAWLYFRRGGLLDGWQGIYVCLGSAAYPSVVEYKAWRRSS